jgi:hypothetical protein
MRSSVVWKESAIGIVNSECRDECLHERSAAIEEQSTGKMETKRKKTALSQK